MLGGSSVSKGWFALRKDFVRGVLEWWSVGC